MCFTGREQNRAILQQLKQAAGLTAPVRLGITQVNTKSSAQGKEFLFLSSAAALIRVLIGFLPSLFSALLSTNFGISELWGIHKQFSLTRLCPLPGSGKHQLLFSLNGREPAAKRCSMAEIQSHGNQPGQASQAKREY